MEHEHCCAYGGYGGVGGSGGGGCGGAVPNGEHMTRVPRPLSHDPLSGLYACHRKMFPVVGQKEAVRPDRTDMLASGVKTLSLITQRRSAPT